MCGIAGLFGSAGSDTRFDALFAELRHRGPDGSGVFRDGQLVLGMNRLRFRGSEVALPVHAGGAVCAFNGQVYGELASGGYAPVADGLPNEIALAVGSAHADGMFAYSRYAPERGQLTLGTDWHFIKPLFVRDLGGEAAFASEIAPLLKLGRPPAVQREALAELFAYGWYLSDQTCAEGVSLVWKNDVTIGADGLHRQTKRARVPAARAAGTVDQLRAAITQSVRRSVSGTGPLGLALSGGLDSSILAWELNALGVEDLICITVQTADGNEDIASLAQLNLPAPGPWQTWKHVVVTVDDGDFLAAFASSTHVFGQPTTMSSLPLYQRLADTAAAHGVRAMLLGEGVDEYFAGYASYAKAGALPALLDYYRSPARLRLVRTLFGPGALGAAEARFEGLYGGCDDLRAIETQLRLTRLLLRSDVCLMSRSIEGRVPFLYNDIPALALSIPWSELAAAPGKTALRHAYRTELGERALRAKIRFKSSDAMLLRCLEHDDLAARIIRECGRVFGPGAVRQSLDQLRQDEGFDADILCLLMSLTFLLEGGLLDAHA